MYFLSLRTPAGSSGPPSPEHMAEMGKLVEEVTRNGKLVTTGALGRRDPGGFAVTRLGATYTVDEKPTAAWMLGGGFAIISAPSRAQAIADTRRFLEVAGDGVSEVIELAFGSSHLEQAQ